MDSAHDTFCERRRDEVETDLCRARIRFAYVAASSSYVLVAQWRPRPLELRSTPMSPLKRSREPMTTCYTMYVVFGE